MLHSKPFQRTTGQKLKYVNDSQSTPIVLIRKPELYDLMSIPIGEAKFYNLEETQCSSLANMQSSIISLSKRLGVKVRTRRAKKGACDGYVVERLS